MKIKPLADRVLIKIESEETQKVGSLYIPQTAQEKTNTGVVAEIGDDKDVINVKVGDKVMYDKYAGTKLEADGSEFLLVRISDVLAVVE
ncbi:MAG: co-chaperone GroES [Spirochaetales bacterium]|uniref:Co-chaperonin GroES n=1 Tax=Candidatus Thalassospirochaeta sargassi TaxID=3119039 RepID=A0AAJ1MKC9_9SPIO|nr:co-chaperone GroES [Spirochaetales bacterium]